VYERSLYRLDRAAEPGIEAGMGDAVVATAAGEPLGKEGETALRADTGMASGVGVVCCPDALAARDGVGE
jgi:hypothetical protein